MDDKILSLYDEYNRASYIFMCSQLVMNLSIQGLQAIPEDTYFRLIASLNSDVVEFRDTLGVLRSLLEEPDPSVEEFEKYKPYFTPFYELSERVFNTIIQHPLPSGQSLTAIHTLIRTTSYVGLSYLRGEADVSLLLSEDNVVTRRHVLNFYMSLPDHLKSSPSSQFIDILNSVVKDNTKTPRITSFDSPLSLKEIVQAFTSTQNTTPTFTQFVSKLLEQVKSTRVSRFSS